MEIVSIEFEEKLVLIKNNQTIHLTVFLTEEAGTIKFGIDAPRGLVVNREEIYKKKLAKITNGLGLSEQVAVDYSPKTQQIFTQLMSITNKSEKLEVAAKQLFDKDKILTPKSIERIANGDMGTSSWLVTCALDILIEEKPESIKNHLSANSIFKLWAMPLIKRALKSSDIIAKAQKLKNEDLSKLIIHYAESHKV
jgi:sRNA-binding carbon storage regulator CsrA